MVQKGSKPKVKSFPGRSKISYSGFVIPETGVLFTDSPLKFNFLTSIASVRAFLKSSPVPQGKKYAVVMDNAPWHKKMYRLVVTEKLDEYADIRDSVKFIMLPPYSPDLNPIEQVWRITRAKILTMSFSILSIRSNPLLIMLSHSGVLLILNYALYALDCRIVFVVYYKI